MVADFVRVTLILSPDVPNTQAYSFYDRKYSDDNLLLINNNIIEFIVDCAQYNTIP